jgi:hypothetical protein
MVREILFNSGFNNSASTEGPGIKCRRWTLQILSLERRTVRPGGSRPGGLPSHLLQEEIAAAKPAATIRDCCQTG